MALRKFLFFNSSEGFNEEQASTDEISLGKVTAVGVSGISIDAGSARIVNVGTPTTGTDAVNRDYVQAYAAGLDWKQSVRLGTVAALPAYTAAGSGVGKTLTADANGALNDTGIDSVTTIALNDRVLVKDEGVSDIDHGIYTVTDLGSAGTPWVLTRATDADSNAEMTANMAVFIEEGTVNSDTGWTLVTNNTITLDTTALQFSQFTGTGAIVAGKGLLKTGSTIDVELHTAADAQSAGNGGGSSGLEFDAAGVGGQLRAAVHATAGLERTASGLGVKLNGTTLQSAAGGVSVKGLPSLFEIATVATSANVTSANLGTLTAGTTSDASSLHFHPKHVQFWTASGAIAKGDAVRISGNDVVSTGANSADASSRIIGVADAAISDTASGPVLTSGICTGILSGATANTPYYLGSAGTPVLYGALGGGARVIRLGYAVNATALQVQIQDLGKKA